MEVEIIMQIIKAIMECIQDRKVADVKAGLLNPGRREYRGIVRMLRKEDELHGRELREEAAEVFAMLCEADAEDIDLLVADAIELQEAVS